MVILIYVQFLTLDSMESTQLDFNIVLQKCGLPPVCGTNTYDSNVKHIGALLECLCSKDIQENYLTGLFKETDLTYIRANASVLYSCIQNIKPSLNPFEEYDPLNNLSDQKKFFDKMVKIHDDGIYKNIERMMKILIRKLNKKIGVFLVGDEDDAYIIIGRRSKNAEESDWILIHPTPKFTEFRQITGKDFKRLIKSFINPCVCPIFRADLEDIHIFETALTFQKKMKKWKKEFIKNNKSVYQIARECGYGGSISNLKPKEFVEIICHKNGWKFGKKSSVLDALACILPETKGIFYTTDGNKNVQWKDSDESKIKELNIIIIVRLNDQFFAIINPVLKK